MIRCDKKRVGIPADILDLGSRSLFSILSYIGHPLWRSFIGPFSHSNHCSILPFGLSKNSRIAIRLFLFSAQHLIIKLQQQKQKAIDFQWLLFLYTSFCESIISIGANYSTSSGCIVILGCTVYIRQQALYANREYYSRHAS